MIENMLPEVSHKQKMFINMLVAQFGFLSLTSIMVFFDGSATVAIVVNLIFAILVGLLQLAAYNRVHEGIQVFNLRMQGLIDYAFMRTNRMPVVEYKHTDEIGWVLEEFDKFTVQFDQMRKEDMKVLGEVVLSLSKVERGTYQCGVKATSSNFMIRELSKVINNMIVTTSANINELKKALAHYTNNDFRSGVNIDPKLTDDLKEVMTGVNELGRVLKANASKDLQNGQVLEQNSSTMSSSVHHLAQRANEQAASLEETAAALEEITSLTRNNAENAAKMATLGTTVKASVSKGEQLAGSTTKAMDEINTQITSINEAITVIDQIAFQTNILSLNAAVEAATAGEAGKGFAVVAGEVRNLASRSAEAAKEIKALVESATSKANDGKKIADEMIKGYHDLNTHITHTINLISDVSTASKEQMTGIEQINDAVTMLDRVTQENASEANNVSNIANEVLEMANALVSDAKSKKF